MNLANSERQKCENERIKSHGEYMIVNSRKKHKESDIFTVFSQNG
jgi:hypothetical protein